MDFQAFLDGLIAGSTDDVLIAAGAVALLVFGIIELIDTKVRQIETNAKFWLAFILSFSVAIGAYLVNQFNQGGQIELNGLFLACAVGYSASQLVHKGKELLVGNKRDKEMEAERMANIRRPIPQGHTPITSVRDDENTDYSNSGDVQPERGRGPSGGL